MDKVFISGYSSLIEAKLRKLELSSKLNNIKYLVDKIINNLINKITIVTFPIDISKFKGKVISRIPLKTNKKYEFVPYELPKITSVVRDQDYSLIILNKYMMSSLDNLEKVDQTDYLLGIGSIHENYLTSIGYKLVTTDLNKFN
jgi:hypothetical protein